MTTVKEFKEWLNRFPDDTIVRFGYQQRSGSYESYGPVKFKSPILQDIDYGSGWDYIDFTGNEFVGNSDERYNKRYLDLGEAD